MYRGLERTRCTQAVADIDTASSRLADLRRRRLMHACEDPLHVCKRAQYTYCSTPVLPPPSPLDRVEIVAASLINRLRHARQTGRLDSDRDLVLRADAHMHASRPAGVQIRQSNQQLDQVSHRLREQSRAINVPETYTASFRILGPAFATYVRPSRTRIKCIRSTNENETVSVLKCQSWRSRLAAGARLPARAIGLVFAKGCWCSADPADPPMVLAKVCTGGQCRREGIR